MKEIKLSQGKIALVDDYDYNELNQYQWTAKKDRNTFYAERKVRENSKQITIKMHRQILGLTPGDGILSDHKNRNGLDNQRENLRVATRSLNGHNRIIQKNNTAGYTGVSRHCGKWKARIKVNGVSISCGDHENPFMAALAYDQAAIKYHRENARLNFPERM